MLLFVSFEFPPTVGGISRYVSALASELHAQGVSVSVLTKLPTEGSATPPFAFPIYRMRFSGHSSIAFWFVNWLKFFRRLLSLTTPLTHVVLFDFYSHIWAALCTLVLPLKYSVVICGSEVSLYRKHPILRRLMNRFLRRADRVIAISSYTRELALQCFPDLSPHRITVVYVPVIFPEWNGSQSARIQHQAIVRQALGIPEQNLVLVHVARLTPRKGHAALVSSLSKLPDEVRARITYLAVGDGPARAALNELVNSLNLGSTVQLLGKVSEQALLDYYDASDALVLPSEVAEGKVEGFGIVILEAAKRGVPTIGARHGAIPELIVHERTGLLFSDFNSADFTEWLVKSKEPRTLLRQLGEQARTHASQVFDGPALARKFIGTVTHEPIQGLILRNAPPKTLDTSPLPSAHQQNGFD